MNSFWPRCTNADGSVSSLFLNESLHFPLNGGLILPGVLALQSLSSFQQSLDAQTRSFEQKEREREREWGDPVAC